jgi:hypothetical protein
MGNNILKPKVNISHIIWFVRIVSLIFASILVMLIQMSINTMLQEGINYAQLFISISAFSIIIGMLLTLRFMKTGSIITILGSLGLGISTCIASNGVSHLLPFTMAVGFVFAIIPFLIGLVFLIIDKYK